MNKLKLITIILILTMFSNNSFSQKTTYILVNTIECDSVSINIESLYYCYNDDSVYLNIDRYTTFYINNNIKEKYTESYGLKNGEYVSYYLDGSIKEIFFYANDRIIGPYYKFYPNGFMMINGFYKSIFFEHKLFYKIDSIPRDSLDSFFDYCIMSEKKSIKHSTWLYYDKQGNLIRKERYKDGKLEETIIIE